MDETHCAAGTCDPNPAHSSISFADLMYCHKATHQTTAEGPMSERA